MQEQVAVELGCEGPEWGAGEQHQLPAGAQMWWVAWHSPKTRQDSGKCSGNLKPLYTLVTTGHL